MELNPNHDNPERTIAKKCRDYNMAGNVDGHCTELTELGLIQA